jgi:Rrf2 family transcriptional regulator, cysteine metabolism repressor
MKLNTKIRNGTRAMLELALHHQKGVVNLSDIAASQEISEKYSELSFSSLRSARLVYSQRGVQGGYVLARPHEQITLRYIFYVL